MTNLKQRLREQSFILREKDEEWSIEDIIAEVKEWLTDKLKDNECCAECDIINRFIKTELLGELK